MEIQLLINIVITGICLFVLGLYFNSRERKITRVADKKFEEIKENYIAQIIHRKAKEKQDIERLKGIVAKLQDKQRELATEKPPPPPPSYLKKVDEIMQKATEKAKKIEAAVQENAKKFLDEQKTEVQTKMVDMVIGVSKKVLPKALNYEDHKSLIEEALGEIEGEVKDDGRN